MTDPRRIGFVGLGAIGAPIALALRRAGHDLVVHDTRADAVADLVAGGCEARASAAEVASDADVVFVSLPSPDAVRTVAIGAGGLVEGTRISTYVDLSTTGTAIAVEVAQALAARGVDVVDAPVSGGVAGAEAGTLTVMVAGTSAAIERIEPLLDVFGGTVLRVGDTPGQGQVAKLLNNLLSATAMAITSEAMVLGAEHGLEPETLLAVFNASSGRNTATSDKFPKHVVTGRFASGFRLQLMAKDVGLAQQEARSLGVQAPLADAVQQIWAEAARACGPDADHTELARYVAGRAGTAAHVAGGAAS